MINLFFSITLVTTIILAVLLAILVVALILIIAMLLRRQNKGVSDETFSKSHDCKLKYCIIILTLNRQTL